MAELAFHTLDVFTERKFGGNQLAVFPDAPELDAAVMQTIAREFNLSETVFVRPAEMPGALRRLRIFTPGSELPFAGHPTIGTAQLLVELGIATFNSDGVAEFAFEEGVGLVPVRVVRSATGGFFTWLTAARAPERGPEPPPRDKLAALLGLDPAEIVSDAHDRPSTFTAGVPFLFVPVRDKAALGRASIDLALWRTMLAGWWAEDVYLFCPSDNAPANLQARMFAPAMGIPEDPATGGAAAALAGYLWERHGGPGEWVIAQGVEMGRPSTLHVQVEGSASRVERVRVGGAAVRVSHGTLTL